MFPTIEAAVQAVTAPNYVLEESLSDQLLWKETAGNRPPQPVEMRALFEAQLAENFARSEVEYQMPFDVLTATTPHSLNPFADGNFGTDGTGVIVACGTPVADVGSSRIGGGDHHNVADIVSSFVVPGGSEHGKSSQQNQHRHRVVRSNSGSGGNLIVYAKGDNVFGTTVSKSFARPSINGELVSGVDTVNISIASYRVVEVRSTKDTYRWLVILLHLCIKRNGLGIADFSTTFNLIFCLSFRGHYMFLTTFVVREAWEACSISCHLPRGYYTRYNRGMETLFGFSRII